MGRGFFKMMPDACFVALLLSGGCGDSVVWFVSFHSGEIDAAHQDGLVLIIGQAHPKPLKSVRLLEGDLPLGMDLQEDGTVRGIPEETGSFDFTIELTELSGEVLQKSYSVEVEASAGGN